MPRDVEIIKTDDETPRLTSGTDPNLAYDAGGTADDVQINATEIEGLTDATIRLQAARDIESFRPITLSASGQGLTLQAGGGIALSPIANLQADGTIRLDAGSSEIPGSDPNGSLRLHGSLTSTRGGVELTAAAGGAVYSNIATATGLTINTPDTVIPGYEVVTDVYGVVSGAGGLTLNGSGTTVLFDSNTYTGATTVNAGTLTLENAASISGSEAVHVASGATLDTSRIGEEASATIKGLSGAGNIVTTTYEEVFEEEEDDSEEMDDEDGSFGDDVLKDNSSKGLTLTGSGTYTFGGVVSGKGGLTLEGAGTQILTGANSYTGETVIKSGRLQLGDGGTSGSISSSAAYIIGNIAPSDSRTSAALAVNRSDTLELNRNIVGDGSFVQMGAGTTILSANNYYNGGTSIQAGSLELAYSTSAGIGTISFDSMSGSASAQLVLEQSAQVTNGTFTNTLNDFGDNEALVLRGFAFSGTESYTVSNGTLTVTGGTNGTQTQTFTLSNTNETTYFARSDGQGGTIISSDLVCYAEGTRIRTMDGETAVEALAVGDVVVTASGQHRPIRWIGSQTVDGRSHPKPGAVLPVRIAAGALGENRPTRDLWVSPRHAIGLDLLGEVLVPADALINGATITQERVETITYWHVELDSHDLLVAEGVAAESYLDLGNRGFFGSPTESDATPDAAGPDAALTRADCCRPFVESGPILDFARARLRERAVALGWSLRPDPLAGLHLVADGQVIVPRVAGTAACFLLPAACGDVRLVSGTSVPEHATGSGGRRRLGVDLRGLMIDDGLTMRRAVSLDDPRLDEGFHRAEGTGAGLHRWTKGDALLPASLWADCQDVFFLRLELGGEGLLRWHAPEEAILPAPRVTAGKPQLRLVEAA